MFCKLEIRRGDYPTRRVTRPLRPRIARWRRRARRAVRGRCLRLTSQQYRKYAHLLPIYAICRLTEGLTVLENNTML